MRQEFEKDHHHTALDRLFRYAEFLKFGEVHIKFDHATGLRAIIAIHNSKRGPALGGCRLVHYATSDDALEDALRLAHMMSLKAAISNLPHGGAKAVLLLPSHEIHDRKKYMEVFAGFVQDLNGRYITAVDSGTDTSDMNIIATITSYVSGYATANDDGNPSPYTGFGVRRGIEAAVKFRLGKDNLEGIHVAIQGVGHAGYALAKELHAAGARLTLADVNQPMLERCAAEFGATICPPNAIYDVVADVFAPCAFGSILNLETIKRLRVPIVAGSANNQLAHQHYSVVLREHNILYAPDFVINSGGLIYCAAMYAHADPAKARIQVGGLYDTLMTIFNRSHLENRSTSEIAEMIALEALR